MRTVAIVLVGAALGACTRAAPVVAVAAVAAPAPGPGAATPLVFGETIRLDSRILGERRVVNVYLPPDYATPAAATARFPVLYMPDGGVAEDFVHIAGLVDVSIRNGVIRPLIVVGVENTDRRRDLLSPSAVADDRAAAPHAGGADRFRAFLRDELRPYVAAHYRTTAESAIVGESLAGLFVLETFLVEPTLFDTYIAIDPSVWWNAQALVHGAAARLASWPADARTPKTVWVTTSEEPTTRDGITVLAAAVAAAHPAWLTWTYAPLPAEHHATIYPIGAAYALRAVFALPPSDH